MSLEAILEAIRANGEDQILEIERRANTQAQEILAEAHIEVQRIENETCAEVAAPAIRERAHILNRAHLEVIQIMGSVRQTLVDAAIEQCCQRLTGIRATSGYPVAMHHLTEEALSELVQSSEAPTDVRMEADPRDQELLDEILHGLEIDLPRSYDLNCTGGLAVMSEDGRVVVINTLEARLDRALPYLRRYLTALFETDHQDVEHNEVGPGHHA